MARTVSEIYNELIFAKNAQPDLNTLLPTMETADDLKADLTSNSVVGIWRLWLWIVAVGSHTVELLFDKHTVEIETFVASKEWGTLQFLQKKAFEFQFGYLLTFNGSQFTYSTVDLASQIVKRAAVVVAGTQVQFKVAKLDGLGIPIKLTDPEKDAFSIYIDSMVYAGTQFIVISNDPDEIKLNFDIVFNPLVIAADGSLVLDPTTFPVVDAINEFISNLPFNGVLNLTKLVDYLQTIDGIDDPVLIQGFAKYGGLSYSVINKNYIPIAGHAVLDEPNSTLTYINSNSI